MRRTRFRLIGFFDIGKCFWLKIILPILKMFKGGFKELKSKVRFKIVPPVQFLENWNRNFRKFRSRFLTNVFFCHQCPTLLKPLACRSSAPALMPHSWHQLIVADHDFEMDFSRRNFINRMARRALAGQQLGVRYLMHNIPLAAKGICIQFTAKLVPPGVKFRP